MICRRKLMQAGLALGWPLVGTPSARACEVLVGGFRILHPWTRATAAGEASAPLCMTIDQVSIADRLVSVTTPVAEAAEMAGSSPGPGVDWSFDVGTETVFSERGTFVRLVGLRHPLFAGRVYPLELGFEKAGPVAATLSVDFGRFS